MLGEAPSRSLAGRWSQPLYGPTARRVVTWIPGTTASHFESDDTVYARLQEFFELRNAVQHYENAYPWTPRTTLGAQRRWNQYLLGARNPPPAVVCLGRKAAAATSVAAHLDFFEWSDGYVVIPHPSGLNRMYNSVEVRRQAERTVREAIERCTWPSPLRMIESCESSL